MPDARDVIDRPERNRFELPVGNEVAIAAYRRDGDVTIFTHTEVPEALEGRGIGGALIEGALGLIRAGGGRIVPVCSFVQAYVERHPDAQELLAR